MKYAPLVIVAVAIVAAGLGSARGQDARPSVGFEELKALYRDAPLVVLFQVEAVQANPTVAPRLVWEVQGPVLEVIKGRVLPGKILVHVDSIVRVFDTTRTDMAGKQFVAAIKPLGDAVSRRFQVVGPVAFAAGGQEADVLRKLSQTDVETGSGGTGLELTVRPIDKVFRVDGPKTIEVRLTNTSKESATYLQAPISEKDGRLYLTGQGLLRIRDTTGATVADKGNIALGQVPPPPPKPALILPGANFVETVDLAKYFNLSEGRYTLVLLLNTPDGRTRIPSNGFSFQVGTVITPEPPPPPKKTEPVATPPERPVARPVKTTPPEKKPTKPAADVPDPATYKPGKPSVGLAGLLRPIKATCEVGEPVGLELRLINEGPRTLAVDTRLERTLTIQVESVGESPQPLVIRQVIPWPVDGSETLPEQRAYLREGAFWGRTINLNTLYGRSLNGMLAPTPEEVAAGKDLSYERFGKHLFGFPKPGFYTITATYTVTRPLTADGKPPAAPPKLWWVGEIQTNPVTVEIAEKGRG